MKKKIIMFIYINYFHIIIYKYIYIFLFSTPRLFTAPIFHSGQLLPAVYNIYNNTIGIYFSYISCTINKINYYIKESIKLIIFY